jgi:hypothetical protein
MPRLVRPMSRVPQDAKMKPADESQGVQLCHAARLFRTSHPPIKALGHAGSLKFLNGG